jgi:MraZ protein
VAEIGSKWEDVFIFTHNQYPFMSRFKGDHYCKVDSKGRILFPAKLKKQTPAEAGEVFVGKLSAFEKSLVLYPENVWSLLVKRTLRTLNPYNAQHDLFRRDFFRDVVELEFDSSGRILLPKRFLDILKLTPGEGGDVVLAGQGDRVELMSKDQYQASELSSDDRKSLSQEVMGNFTWDDED